MQMVLITALGVGGASVIGALIGFCFKNISHKMSDIILSFAAGVMLAASVIGLILPSLEYGGKYQIIVTIIGIFCGALCVNLIDKIVPHLHKLTGVDDEAHPEMQANINKVLLFVIAIGVHNLPEGLATGVSFGTGNINDAIMVALSIARQNIPEGMVIIAPMLSLGISKARTLGIAFLTGAIEIVGTLLGYLLVSVISGILPFFLSLAGGSMIYVIVDELIPETNENGRLRGVSYALLLGFSLMIVINSILN